MRLASLALALLVARVNAFSSTPQPPPCEPISMTLVTVDFTANWAAASQLGTYAGTAWTGMKWLLKTSEGVAHEFEHPVATGSNFPCGAPSIFAVDYPLPEPDCECGLQNTYHEAVELECGVEYTIETTPVSDMTNMFATSENFLCPLWYFVPTANLEQLREGMVMMCENSDFQLEGAAGGPKTTAYFEGAAISQAAVEGIGALCSSDYTSTFTVENGAPSHTHISWSHAFPSRIPIRPDRCPDLDRSGTPSRRKKNSLASRPPPGNFNSRTSSSPGGTSSFPLCDAQDPYTVPNLIEFYANSTAAPPLAIQAIINNYNPTSLPSSRRALSPQTATC